jgi:hypothetical protein
MERVREDQSIWRLFIRLKFDAVLCRGWRHIWEFGATGLKKGQRKK